jgi:hypothetical protein
MKLTHPGMYYHEREREKKNNLQSDMSTVQSGGVGHDFRGTCCSHIIAIPVAILLQEGAQRKLMSYL